jgi:hypothetical protein
MNNKFTKKNMTKEEIKASLRKMKKSIIFMENHVNNFYGLNTHYQDSNVNPIAVRNIMYIDNAVQRIKGNFDVMKTLDNKNPENKFIIKKKFIISMVLLKHVNTLIKEKKFEDDDYEVHHLIFKDGKKPDFMKLIPKKYEDDVKEEFEAISRDKKIIEGFSLGALPKFFTSIGKAFKSIIGSITQIGSFIFGMLTKFIMLLWKLLMWIMDLIFKIIPKLIKSLFNFFKLVILKLIKIGMFMFFLFAIIIMVLMKYMQNLFEMGKVPFPVVILPAIFITLHLFWNETKLVYRIQTGLLNGIIWIFTGPIKYVMQLAFGLPRNDPFFRYRGRNSAQKSLLFINMIMKNIGMIIIRFFILLLLIKYCIKYGVPMILKGIPNMKEMLIFPLIVSQYIYVYMKKLLNLFIGPTEE